MSGKSHNGGVCVLKIVPSRPEDAGMARARLSPLDLNKYSLIDGGLIELEGERRSAFRLVYDSSVDEGCVGLDPVGMKNVGREAGGEVRFYKVGTSYAERAAFYPLASAPFEDLDRGFIRARLKDYPVNTGDEVCLTSPYGREVRLRVGETFPGGTVTITASTEISIEKPQLDELTKKKITYADIGGLDAQLRRIREMIELPLKFPEAFVRLGVEPPKGVLLYGPPGTGKTVIAKAVASESDAWFTSISGPEIIGKYYGESEERLRAVFEEAQQNAPAIIFIDEVDAIAPKREEMGGEKQVERRVVAQLLTLMDGLSARGQVVVIAATNIPNTLDPALRRPGRFDREIAIPIPDRAGRLEILKIHTRGMPLAADVDLERLADVTHGFVGADLQALAKESAMMALRRLMPSLDAVEASGGRFENMEITMADFRAALREIEASAIREVFVEIPNTTWDDVGGLSEIKEQLIEAVQWPLKKSALFRRWGVTPPRGIMIHGVSGTGKTLLVKALAHESGVNFISVKGPSLMSRYVGESERALREVFRTARQAAPSILYFDEIDSLVPVRGSDGSAQAQITDRVISQFLSEMSGIEDMGGVVVVATTNRIDRIDPAMFSAGRFELVLELPLPDRAAREEILRICLKKLPLDGVRLDELAACTDGMNGAEIAEVCRAAAMEALREQIRARSDEEPRLRMEHFEAALEAKSRRDRSLESGKR
ncbi:MAG: CDC48 family AAA ATPase [Pyramidobacter sp.]|nr:CDC48 family AAA ATPase [Pyramidobacter sp.]